MLSLFGDQKFKAFGLDISDVSIKVMQLQKKDRAYFPFALSDVPLAQKVIKGHIIVDQSKLAENIKKAIAAARNVNTPYVVSSVPESKSFVRVLQIPKMPESEIRSALPFELEQNIPVPIDLVYMDWKVLREVADNLELLVTATPKDYIDSLVGAIKEVGLKPVAMELESQAMARTLVGEEDKQSTVLIVDISSTQTSFVVVELGNAEYTSSIPIAGNAFTESIARNLSMTASEAEAAKRKQGLIADIKQGNIKQAILPILDNIIDEMKNVIHFYEEHSTTKANITKIVLSGGSAKLPGLVDYISARLSLTIGRNSATVVLGDPWVNILASSKLKPPVSSTDALSYTTVAGLALRGAEL